MMKKIPNNIWLSVVICFALALLVVISVYSPCAETGWINNSILALTAFVILWYTLETAAMKAEVARQNRLQTRPILTLILGDKGSASLKNEGKGPALNSSATVNVQSALGEGATSTNEVYEVHVDAYIPQDSTHELKMYRYDKNSGAKGTVSEPDVLYQIGKVVRLSIRYEDIDEHAYVSDCRVRSGRLEWISLGGHTKRRGITNR